MVREADVLVQNFRPGVAERIGIGYEALAAENPGLVYVAISGFGPEGPYADQPAYDMLIQALSGLAHDLGEPGKPKLVKNDVLAPLPDSSNTVTVWLPWLVMGL